MTREYYLSRSNFSLPSLISIVNFDSWGTIDLTLNCHLKSELKFPEANYFWQTSHLRSISVLF